MTAITAFEIYAHPKDLCFIIGNVDGGRYTIAITRGPGHNGKMLLSSSVPLVTRGDALQIIKDTLEAVLSTCTSVPADPSGTSLDQTSVERILARLQTEDVVRTYDLVPA